MNMDKHYLADLQQKGVHVIPTVYIDKNTKTSLVALYNKTNWAQTILKPCISGGAWHTYKLDKDNLAQHEDIFQKLI